MNIVTGINNFEEVVKLIKISDEFYFGLNFINNHRKYFNNLNLKDIKTAIEIINFVREKNKNIYLVANETYTAKEIKFVVETIEKLVDNGLSGVIIRDLNLGFEIKNLTNIIISSTAIIFNKNAIDFYKNFFPIKRIIIPQHLKFCEAKKLILENPNIEFEIFYFPEVYCTNIDGTCIFHTFEDVNNKMGCFNDFFICNNKFKPVKPNFNLRLRKFNKWIELDIISIKVPRDYDTSEKIKIVKRIKNEYIRN